MKNMKVNNIIIGNQLDKNEKINEFIKIVKEKSIKVSIVNKGDCIKIEDELYLNILWPDKNLVIEDNAINNNALVFKMKYRKFSLLFTGDIEEKAEEKLVERYKGTDALQANVLKVAHHGSKSSSTEEFINMVNPKIALIGVGKNNLYGHPSNQVIENFKNLGIVVFRTDENGEIEIDVTQNGKIHIWKMIN